MKRKILFFLYGSSIMEAWTLDMLLDCLKDGIPRSYEVFTTPTGEISVWELSRKTSKLIEDSLVEVFGENVIITSKGMLHLSQGGYVAEFIKSKKTNISFWLSIIAVVISIATAVISWF